MLNCKKVTHLLSEAQDRKLSLPERAHLELHLAMCSGCRNYKYQMRFLRKACERYLVERSGENDDSGR